MSDTLKPPPPPPKPEGAPPEKRPLEKPKVDVIVTPKTKGDKPYADKVRENLKKEVEKVVKENADGGHVEQMKKAADKTHEVGGKVDPGKVKEIGVNVSGRVGNKKIGEETVVTPAAPKPPAAPPPAPAPEKKK